VAGEAARATESGEVMGMSAMELKVTDRGQVAVVVMTGDLEVQEIGDFKAVMDQIMGRGDAPLAVLDLSGVTRLTSYVVALVGYYNAQFKQAGGKFVVAGATVVARRSFELSGLASVLTMVDSTEAALKELGGKAK
jgi:anti-anti-sigma factor